MKLFSLLTAFTIGLVLGNRTGRQAQLREMAEALTTLGPTHQLTEDGHIVPILSDSNSDAVVRLRGDHA